MALTLTVGTLGTGTLAALAGGAAIAGAVGLGIAGLAAKFAGGRRRGRGGGRRRGHGGRHGFRGKREVATDPQAYADEVVDERTAVRNLLQVIREEDATGCGMKLVCELAATRNGQLLEEEEAILSLVGVAAKPGEGVLPPGGAGDYLAARSYGWQYGDCTQAFPLCPPNGTELMGAVLNYLP